MTVLVVGGTGVVGRPTVAALRRRGHDVRVASRSGRGVHDAPGVAVDVRTGEGLAGALQGARVVVDLSHLPSPRRGPALRFVREGTARLLVAVREAGVGHHVLLSVVGIDDVPYAYYEAKVAQEEAVASGGLAWSVLRAAQVHDAPGQVLAQGAVGPLALVPRMRVRPVAAQEVGEALADVVDAGPSGRVHDLVGPQEEDLVDMARRWVAARGGPRRVLGLRVPGRAGRAMRDGTLGGGPGARRGTLSYSDWLAGTSTDHGSAPASRAPGHRDRRSRGSTPPDGENR